jgi:hypothetical protein
MVGHGVLSQDLNDAHSPIAYRHPPLRYSREFVGPARTRVYRGEYGYT